MTKKNRHLTTKGRTKSLKRNKKSKSIPIKVLEENIHRCPLVNKENGYDFDFVFMEECSVSSCQYFSHRTSRKCMKLDVKLPSKDFTDSEIFYYKIGKNPDFPPSEVPKPRTVNLLRKKTAIAVKANIVFYYFTEYVLDNYSPEDTNFVYKKGLVTSLDQILEGKPFNQKGIEHFKEWQLPHLFNSETYKRFCEENKNLLMTSSDINLNTVLRLTPVKFAKIQKVVQGLCDLEYQSMLSDTLF